MPDENLIPEDLVHKDLRTPLAILKQQAAFFNEKTKPIVEAIVESTASTKRSAFSPIAGGEPLVAHSFVLLVPTLDNYRFVLFRIRHGVAYYPLEFVTGNDSSFENIPTEEKLIDKIKEFFSKSETKNTVSALVQSGSSEDKRKEVYISPEIVLQLMNGKPIRFTVAGGKEEAGFIYLTAVGRDKYLAQVAYPTNEKGIIQSKAIELSQEQLDTIGWSEDHKSFIGSF